MRAELSVILGLSCLLFSTPSFSDELPDRLAVAALVEKDGSGVYKLQWQRRLLAIQQALAAKLTHEAGVDYMATGSITPTDPGLPTP